ncbi:helix-turn-helix domain-containing protein [Pelagibius sp. CAU 1746]|uniref:AraC family transcriptional regulator n=1 Tax=Pelagibius sp. CAU 1746 TaxID=3140370 RepID=UPI00325C2733
MLRRPLGAALRPFVSHLWAGHGGPLSPGPSKRERMLPADSLHLVIRLEDRPLRVYRDLEDLRGTTVSAAVVGGLRTSSYLRDVSRPAPCVGAMLRPGVAGFLVGAPAGAIAGGHVALEDLWHPVEVDRLRSRLAEAASLGARLDIFEAALAARLPSPAAVDPRIASALAGFAARRPVAQVVGALDVSHRHFTATFREAVGLAPKSYCRLLRFGEALDRLHRERDIGWAALAAAAGYADQSHMVREFRGFAGLTPGDYRRRAPRSSRHVPV